MEIWKPIPRFDGTYEVSSNGRLRSVDRVDMAGGRRRGQIIKLRVTKKYYCAGLRYNKEQVMVRVHRLVAEVFISNPKNKPLVNHKNGNTLDNRIKNLEWATHLENTAHAIEKRLTRKPGGKDYTLTQSQVLRIFNSKKTTTVLSKKYGVCLVTINSIRNGRKWSWLTGKKYVSKDGNRKYLDVNGKKLTYSQLAKKLDCKPATITYRIGQGWSIERILSIKPKKRGVHRFIPNNKTRVYK